MLTFRVLCHLFHFSICWMDGNHFLRQLFLTHKEDPPISHNLPPMAGALSWSRGLLERVSLPMLKIKGFDKKVRAQLPT